MSASLGRWSVPPLILLVAPAVMADDATGADARTATVVVAVDGLQKSRSGATWLACTDLVRAALDGLAGIFEVRVDLRRDAFTIRFDPERQTESRIRGTIEALGFRPAAGREHRDGPGYPAAVEIPESLSAALVEARGGDRPVLVEFHADWCAPCTILESRLADPRVQEVLKRFVFVRVDLDVHPHAGAAFRIDAMPTLLALDGSGRELARWVGLRESDELAEELDGIENPASRHGKPDEGCALLEWLTP